MSDPGVAVFSSTAWTFFQETNFEPDDNVSFLRLHALIAERRIYESYEAYLADRARASRRTVFVWRTL